MSFRLRITTLVSLAVGVAVVGASFAVYYIDKHEQFAQVDSDLSASRSLPRLALDFGRLGPATKLLHEAPLGTGNTVRIRPGTTQVVLPRSRTAVMVRVGKQVAGLKQTPGLTTSAQFSTEEIGGVRSRVLAYAVGSQKVELSTSLLDVDRNLSRLRRRLRVRQVSDSFDSSHL